MLSLWLVLVRLDDAFALPLKPRQAFRASLSSLLSGMDIFVISRMSMSSVFVWLSVPALTKYAPSNSSLCSWSSRIFQIGEEGNFAFTYRRTCAAVRSSEKDTGATSAAG